jgi:hypothetical protein
VAAEYTVSEGAPAGDLMDLLQITTLLVVLLLLKWADGASGITFWRLPNHHLRREDRDCHGVDSFTLRAFREDMGHEDLDGVFREESEMS